MTLTLNKQTQQRLKRAAEHIGIPEADVVERALDVFLITEELADLKQLAEDTNYWQQRYLDTVALEEERLANLDHDQRRDMD